MVMCRSYAPAVESYVSLVIHRWVVYQHWQRTRHCGEFMAFGIGSRIKLEGKAQEELVKFQMRRYRGNG